MNRRKMLAALCGVPALAVKTANAGEGGIIVVRLGEQAGRDLRDQIAEKVQAKAGDKWRVLVTEPSVEVEFIKN